MNAPNFYLTASQKKTLQDFEEKALKRVAQSNLVSNFIVKSLQFERDGVTGALLLLAVIGLTNADNRFARWQVKARISKRGCLSWQS